MLESAVAVETSLEHRAAPGATVSDSVTRAELTPSASGHSVRQRYLFALAPQAEVVQVLRTLAVDADPARRDDILARWLALQPTVATMVAREAGFADRVRIEALPDEYRPVVEAFAAHPLFIQSFSAMPAEVRVVDIDEIVAGQRMVNLEVVEAIQRTLPEEPTMSDLVQLCISPNRYAEPVQHLEQNGVHIFSARSVDFRFLGAFLKPVVPDDIQYAVGGGYPTMAVITFVGFGSAPVNAFSVGSRVILNNGFHRLYALRALGQKKAPVVLQRSANPFVELPPAVGGSPRDYLLSAPRPVLMKDFFDSGFAITIETKERLKTVTVACNVNQFDVPV